MSRPARVLAAPLMAVILAMSAAPAARAAEGPAGRPALTLSLAMGLTSQTQDGLERWLESERALVGPTLDTRHWSDALPLASTPRLELAARAWPRWTIAASVEHFESRVEHGSFGGAAAPWLGWDVTHETVYTEYALQAAYWPADAPGVYAGARFGAGHGSITIRGGGRLDASDANAQVLLDGTWSGTVFAPGAFVGWRSAFDADPQVDLRAGWSARDLGTLGPGGGRPAPVDFLGRPLMADFGGPSLSLGFVFALGSAR